MRDEGKKELHSKYDHKSVERRWYKTWKDEGYFKAPYIARDDTAAVSKKSPKGPFSMVIPPPNVTGELHLGHAINVTIQDILARFYRTRGYDTLWLPGTDHAGIATQAKVEEAIAREGLSKHDLGREKFVDRTWEWKRTYHARISSQLESMGVSVDWDRERFTFDEGCSAAVQKVFASLYEKGLIYQGNYLVNWCPKCQTTISDIEVEHDDEESSLWYIRYPVKGEPGRFVTVATTRPETMLGDTAVAVNPEDPRYADLIGRTLILPLMDREIPVIGDTAVDPEFGTGAVKVTPAHDNVDFEMGQRHGLESITVMDRQVVMNEFAGAYQGLDRYEARALIVKDLENLGLLEKIEAYTHAVGHCYRCDVVVEPMISLQWFVKMKPLAKLAIDAVKEDRIRFVPERFERIFLSWMDNVRDWCVSRQLWWGHRIPVWYCGDCGASVCVGEGSPRACPSCGSKALNQDPDVLDTWFSSGLWPFSTMGWPEKTNDLGYYYPTSVLVTGRDIIFFWVARMAFLGLEFMDEVPFHDVLIHGLILDAQGRKMSKSLGNGIDPMELIEEYGADTLRFMLVTGNTPGNDLRFQKERLEGARNFCNKIWNACRFALMNLAGADAAPGDNADFDFAAWFARDGAVELADRWIVSRYHRCAIDVTKALDEYDVGMAASRIYEFLWDELCDWYIEMAKPRLYGNKSPESKLAAGRVLLETLRGTLTLLHPFMPFITEELWQHLPHKGQTIMLSPWVEGDPGLLDDGAEKSVSLMREVVRAARNLRSQFSVAPGKKADFILYPGEAETERALAQCLEYIPVLVTGDKVEIRGPSGASRVLGASKVSGASVVSEASGVSGISGVSGASAASGISGAPKPEKAAYAVVSGVEVYMPLEGLIDTKAEAARLGKDKDKIHSEIRNLESKLSNEGFLSKAPAEVIAKEQERLADSRFRLAALEANLERLLQ